MSYENPNTETHGEALLPGSILLNRYRIERLLGQGGFGITYVAMDLHTNTRMAVKELFPSGYVTRDPDHRTIHICNGKEASFSHFSLRFQQEAQTLMRLQGRNGVLQVTHLFDANKTVYYVMELLDGEDLAHWLSHHQTMTWQQLSPVISQLMDALEQIHKVGLIHRDISPDNIFLTRNSGARLIDFGSVRAYQGGDHFTALIKHGFAPWEQYLSNGSQGPWTDVYALCATAYYALSGTLPPRAPQRRLKDEMVPLEQLCTDLPPHVVRALRKGLAVEPEMRLQSISHLRCGLQLQSVCPSCTLVGLNGVHAEKHWQISPGTVLHLGRSPDCQVRYPANFPGISRHHCAIGCTTDGRLIVMDEGSSCGTRLVSNGQCISLTPGTWYYLGASHICIGSQEEYRQASSAAP